MMATRRSRAAVLAVAGGLALGGCASSGTESTQPSRARTAATTTTKAATTGASEGPTRPFSVRSPWNTPVTGLLADPRSARLITLAQRRQDIEFLGGGGFRVITRTIAAGPFINTRRWSDSIVETTEGVPTRLVCRQQIAYCGDGRSPSTLNVPVNATPQPQFDGWFTIIDRSAGIAFDLWRARRSADGRTISYQFMRKWNLNGPGFLPPGTASARGSGLPLFAGVITPADIQSGRIEHALAISLPGPARSKYVQPASSTDGVGPEGSLPEGARIRLRSGVQLAHLSTGTDARAAHAILEALKTYGAIVVDRARVPTLYAQLNFDWQTSLRNSAGKLIYGNGHPLPAALQGIDGQGVPLLRGNEVQSLRLSDFEVLRLPPELSYPSSAAAVPTTLPQRP